MPSIDVPLFDLPAEPAAPARTAPAVVDRPGPQPALFETAEVLLSPLPTWAGRLAVFDLETTGIDVETSRVVTANVSRLDAAGAVVRRRDWLADPGVEIPVQATAVHGVATARARAEGRPAAEVVGEVVAELRAALEDGYAIVVYNAPYDFTLLAREAVRHGVEPLVEPGPVIDPLVIDKQVDRYRKGKRTLEATAEVYGVELTAAHDAGADAIAAGRVAQALGLRHGAVLPDSAAELHDAQAAWHEAQCADFEDYMRRVRDPGFTARRGWPEVPAGSGARSAS
ncbi:exonuclease domain-containing protein [Herbiconiux moechotypicola]|uniref:3'-5' exonuclease n=1 Tax=Herbiconiux moechotypicola TaxID=637393 RepID=A0ABP5QWH5_9MICO|nr:exonuclease domain-containing protein [Herbiconiux moechotypicola]MCS5731274.1 exonuclease domain-containing protein [Herbiconiux moechotypicola]